MYHTRIITLDFQVKNLPTFKPGQEKEHQEYLAAIGRLVTYGMENEQQCDTIQYANGYVADQNEIVLSFRMIEAMPETHEDGSRKWFGSPIEKLDEFKLWLINTFKSYITIGLVKSSDGKWGDAQLNSIPDDATHRGEFYGSVAYYKRVSYQHLNQVSEEWETLYKWYSWASGEWINVGSGFSPRRLEELK